MLGPLPKMVAPSPNSASVPPGNDVAKLRSELARVQALLAEKTAAERDLTTKLADSEKLRIQYAQMASAMFTENATLRVEQKKTMAELETRAKDAASSASASSAKNSAAITELTQKVSEQTDEITKAQNAAKESQEQLTKKNAELESAQKDLEQTKRQMEDLQRTVSESQSKLSELQIKLDLTEKIKKDAEGNLEKMKTENEAKIAELEKAKAELEKAKAELEKKAEDLNAELDRYKLQPVVKQSEMDELRHELVDTKVHANDMEAAAKKAAGALQTFSDKFKEMKKELEDEKAKNAKLMMVVGPLKTQLDEAKKRAEEAEQKNTEISAKVERLVAAIKSQKLQINPQAQQIQPQAQPQVQPQAQPQVRPQVQPQAQPTVNQPRPTGGDDPFAAMLAEQERELEKFRQTNQQYFDEMKKRDEAANTMRVSPQASPAPGQDPLDLLAKQLQSSSVFTNF